MVSTIKNEAQDALVHPDLSKKKGQANEYDLLIGNHLKYLRKSLAMTQKNLAEIWGVTAQQVQKYEKGQDRISFSKAIELALNLNIDLERFVPPSFSGLYDNNQETLSPPSPTNDPSQVSQAERNKAAMLYASIEDAKQRKTVMDLIKSISEKSA